MRIHIFRHGETQWTKSGRHTGWTDIELSPNGIKEAYSLRKSLKNCSFDHVFASPLKRVKETCEIAGLGKQMRVDPSLLEWNYGSYEGLTTDEIRKSDPNWTIFTKDPPMGETKKEVAIRLDMFLEVLKTLKGEIALFSSGHISRAIAARWLGLDVSFGSLFYLSTASRSILGFERENPVILLWNDTSHLSKPE
ncbi:MAG: histidine phosphatase family protein [Chlamydiae bacterium]|jgi:probable phosphoglycerate mutase|nr:histidine phosphatase family protein [Chlamydiota bacterium]